MTQSELIAELVKALEDAVSTLEVFSPHPSQTKLEQILWGDVSDDELVSISLKVGMYRAARDTLHHVREALALKALEPFAPAADLISIEHPDTDIGFGGRLTVGDVGMRAREALSHAHTVQIDEWQDITFLQFSKANRERLRESDWIQTPAFRMVYIRLDNRVRLTITWPKK